MENLHLFLKGYSTTRGSSKQKAVTSLNLQLSDVIKVFGLLNQESKFNAKNLLKLYKTFIYMYVNHVRPDS